MVVSLFNHFKISWLSRRFKLPYETYIYRSRIVTCIYISAVLAGIGIAIFSGCRGHHPTMSKKTFFAMGTLCSVSLPYRKKAELDEAFAIITNAIKKTENKLSVFKKGSEISRLNALAGQTPLTVSEETVKVLELSLYYGKLSNGAFDITVGHLLDAWGIRNEHAKVPAVPSQRQLAYMLGEVGYTNILISGQEVFFTKKGIEIDLGGIAKGYAIDICYHKLKNAGITDFLINVGGNIRCRGKANNGRCWKVGVRNPFQNQKLVGIVTLTNNQALATSGDYERFVEIGGKRYCHIIDPRTGKPVRGMAGVTVVSRSATEADALSTTLFVQGIQKGTHTLQQCPESDALFIPDTQPVEAWLTSGLALQFEPDPSVDTHILSASTDIMKPGSKVREDVFDYK